MNKNLENRMTRLLPDGIPRYIRCYKSKEDVADLYTVVFTGNYTKSTGGESMYVGMSAHPFDPQGFGQHGSNKGQIDSPSYGHLGKKIKFTELPEDCQKLVISDYNDLWRLTDKK